jgi:LuxR family transcriptional regulator, maltose regulon positive regulatory protein
MQPAAFAAEQRLPPGVQRADRESLTEREHDILQLIATSLSNQEIAARLILSVGTVKWYTGQIYSKLAVQSRTQAVARAHMLQLLS